MLIRKNIGKLYKHALEHEYTIGAYNIFNMESMKAVVEAADEENSPAIVQIGPWTRPLLEPLKTFVRYFTEYMSYHQAPVILHHDHCQTVQSCKEALDAGMVSVMYDGSSLPFEENVKNTRKVVEYAKGFGAWVEAELGSIPGFEHEVIGAETEYTNPEQAREFIIATGCNSLAVSVGTAHGGVEADDSLKIDFDLLKSIKSAVGNTPLVLHGAASLPFELIDYVNKYGGKVPYLRMAKEEDISAARNYGIAKANMDVDNWLCFAGKVRKYLQDEPSDYCPISIIDVGMKAFKDEIKHKMSKVSMSSGYGNMFSDY